jgi:hypothetical protein
LKPSDIERRRSNDPSPKERALFGIARAATLLKSDVLLASDGAGVVGVDHFHGGARITRQGEQVNALAIK